VVESTGLFLTKETCEKHIAAGAKKVIQSRPVKDDTPMFVYGVNHKTYAGQTIISNASCTTNCLAPVAKVLNDKWGIKRGLMTTVHAATATQKTVDGPSTRTGAAAAASWRTSSRQHRRGQGRGRGHPRAEQEAHRHGLPRADLRRVGGRPDRRAEQGSHLRRDLRRHEGRLEGAMKGVLGYTEDKVVATDFRGEPCTSVFDADAGIALDGTFVKVVSWYDNEWGYSNKVLEMVQVIAR
jgi:glyceraldehyde 3-phosphate dehydrogenase